MNRTFEKYKWINLMTFAVMYNFVYLGRFNINNLMNYIAGDLVLTDGQQEAISMSVFISYALGSFINGYLADRFGAKKIVVIGGLFTCVFNVCVPFQDNWTSVLLIWFLNGYFQSMIWVGGISFLSNWWQTGERGKGIGVANFFSGMSHATAYVLPVMVMPIWPAMGWKISFIIPIGVLFLFVVLFAIFARETPESTGLEPYIIENVRYRQREEDLTKIAQNGRLPWSTLFRQSKFCWWCMIAMLSSICRYGLLNWISLYYDNEIGGTLLSKSFSNLTRPVGMAFGTLVITWFAGTKMPGNKGIIVTAMAAVCGTLIIVFPMIDSTQSVLIGIFFAGFTLYGINGILWVHAIDQGCRVFAGSAAGILNGFAYLGACIEGYLFPFVMKVFGSYITVFVVMEMLCILMVICGMVISKKNTIVEPEVHS